MRTHPERLLLLALLIAVIAALQFSGVRDVLTFENIRKNRDALLLLVQERYAASVLLYIGVYIVAIALNVPGAAVLTIAGGFLFGTALAVLYVNIGATAGAALAFLSARYLLGTHLQTSYQEQLAKFNREMEKNGARYLITLRLLPVFPFFLVNFLSGLTRVPLSTFLWTTSLGIIPGSAVYAYAGRQIGTIGSPAEVLSGKVLLAFLLLAGFTLFPVILGRLRSTKKPVQ